MSKQTNNNNQALNANKQSTAAGKTLSTCLSHIQFGALIELFNGTAEGIFVIDEQGTFEFVNPMAAQLLGDSQQSLIGQSLLPFLHETDRDKYMYTLLNWLDIKDTRLNFGPNEVKINKLDGSIIEADLSISNMPQSIACAQKLYVCILHDLSAHKAIFNRLKIQASTDHLTGLANRFTLDESLNKFWAESIQSHQPLSTILIDVDHFKRFNDTYGHIKGDKCLQKIAKVILQCIPSRDCLAARYGGEEFAVILPRCNRDSVAVVARHIQQQINAMSFTDIGLPPEVKVSVSQGIACEFDNQYRTCEALICAADTALYRAKSDGRNKISISA
ncbi:sensor domain-containing diguanylate cyclase [Pseudoalteromonas sp. SR44-5]|uniref:GGDEF domain-containing protein n=1 Tax=Pseudoalteromonas TaxID=53246 RepID=UPI00160358B7|nr:sensor domain-containing diguanylate cyclase [Pseudoalteromonas sp. SR44-5]MBB1364854.1 sensor domain-containing diguanylate cyclase [Pseudoalteromonas sp. SR44-5]